MLEHLTEITAVDPPAANRATDEMLGFILGWFADAFTDVPSPRNHFQACQGSLLSLPTATSGGHKNARDAAAGWTFIGDESWLGADRVDPEHLLHPGLAAWARWEIDRVRGRRFTPISAQLSV